MPTVFKNMDDIRKYVQNNFHTGAKFLNNQSLRDVMKEEADRLKDIVLKKIDDYYDSKPVPSVYDRTHNLKNTVEVSPVELKGGLLSISVFFNDDAYYDSVVWNRNRGSFDEEGFVPILISEGWTWRGEHDSKPYFTEYEGFPFGEMAIEEYNKSNPYGFAISLVKEYEGERGSFNYGEVFTGESSIMTSVYATGY